MEPLDLSSKKTNLKETNANVTETSDKLDTDIRVTNINALVTDKNALNERLLECTGFKNILGFLYHLNTILLKICTIFKPIRHLQLLLYLIYTVRIFGTIEMFNSLSLCSVCI